MVLELASLSVGSPAQVAGPRGPQVGRRDLLVTALCVEMPGNLVGNRLVVHETVFVSLADGLVVQLLSVHYPTLNAGDLGADQGSAVFEGFGVDLRPHLELPVVVQRRIEMPRSLLR